MYRPFISARTRDKLREYMRRGFQTVDDLDDPEVSIILRRTNRETGVVTTFASVKVVMRMEAPGVLMANSEEHAEYAYTTGELRRFAPWDVEVGDVFTTPDGKPAKVTAVPPVRWGVARAVFALDEGVP